MERKRLDGAKVSLITVASSMESSEFRRPAIAVHADLSSLDFIPHTTRDVDNDLYKLTLKIISSISVRSSDNSNPMVEVSFEPKEGTLFTFRMPIQFLSISYTLSLQDTLGGVPILFFDSREVPSINPAMVFMLEDSSFGLLFPDPESAEGEEIQEKFSALIWETNSFPLEPWSEGNGEKDRNSQMVEEVFAYALNATLSLSRGDASPIPNSHDLALQKANEAGHTLPLAIYFEILKNAIESVKVSSPENTTAYGNEDGTKINRFADFEFTRMLRDANLEDSMSSILSKEVTAEKLQDSEHKHWQDSVKSWSAPAEESWFDAMQPVREYLETTGELSAIEAVINSNLLEEGVLESLREQYGESSTLLGIFVYIAMQAHKKHAFVESEMLTDPQKVIINWFSAWKTDDWWEISAMAKELANFNTQNAADILLYGSSHSENSFSAPYLFPFMGTLGEMFLDGDTIAPQDSDEFAKLLEGLGYTSREFKDFESFILRYHRKIMEIMESEEAEQMEDHEISGNALMSLLDPGMDFRKLAESFLWVFPILGELTADYTEHEKFSDEWKSIRDNSVTLLLLDIAEGVGRILKNVEFV